MSNSPMDIRDEATLILNSILKDKIRTLEKNAKQNMEILESITANLSLLKVSCRDSSYLHLGGKEKEARNIVRHLDELIIFIDANVHNQTYAVSNNYGVLREDLELFREKYVDLLFHREYEGTPNG